MQNDIENRLIKIMQRYNTVVDAENKKCTRLIEEKMKAFELVADAYINYKTHNLKRIIDIYYDEQGFMKGVYSAIDLMTIDRIGAKLFQILYESDFEYLSIIYTHLRFDQEPYLYLSGERVIDIAILENKRTYKEGPWLRNQVNQSIFDESTINKKQAEKVDLSLSQIGVVFYSDLEDKVKDYYEDVEDFDIKEIDILAFDALDWPFKKITRAQFNNLINQVAL